MKLLTPQLVAETNDYIVVNKPSGLLVHPADSSPDEKTLVDWLVKKYPATKKVGDEPAVRPGIVHRLDREASGLLVIARTQKMFNALKAQFQDHTIEKEYLVLVHGKLLNNHGEITLPISRASRGGRMAAHGKGMEDAHEAHTFYQVVQRFGAATLLRVKIKTGRTHQIRVHMYALQHPVVGDSLYPVKKTGKNKIGKNFPPAPHLFLHATHLEFQDLGGEKISCDASLPPELETYLTLFKPQLV